SLTDIYEYIFAATQYEVGVLWQSNKITVAHEHYCTAATQFIMSTLYPLIFNAEKKPYKMLGCTVSGSLHELGIRMVSDFFEKDGWNTYYMGANLPNKDIIAAIKEQKVDVLAISISMSFDISKVETLIKNIRSDETLNDLKIIVGGHPFNQIQGLWKLVGADGWAKNARETVELSNQMMSNLNSAK
ncbi:MAG: cobalamin-dependent protein, partial [Ferruginibacter sp.]|nr:cobalamin-dependent protein [Ferruginibacter sp.]